MSYYGRDGGAQVQSRGGPGGAGPPGGGGVGAGGGLDGGDLDKREVTVRKHLTTFNAFMREGYNDLFRPTHKERVLLQPHHNSMRHMSMPGLQRTGPSLLASPLTVLRCLYVYTA